MIKVFSTFPVLIKLMVIGIIAGIILIIPLKVLYELTGNTAYILLFNFDYVPVLNQLRPVWFFGYIYIILSPVSVVSSVFIIF